jgi:hypothetical protein
LIGATAEYGRHHLRSARGLFRGRQPVPEGLTNADNGLLFIAAQRPIVATKLRYYSDPEFAGLFARKKR